MIPTMDWKGIYLRSGGAVIAFSGILLIILSGELVSGPDIDLPRRTAEFLLRAGFGILLIGILMVFLFSSRTIPLELSSSFLNTQGKNMGRLLGSLNLEGNGVYMPAGGRLLEDRVYIPLEKDPLPLPQLSKEMVFNVGTTGPSMGISLLPLGLDMVDKVEEETGRRFKDDSPADAEEALERIGKGTGIFRDIKMRLKADNVELRIFHARLKGTCDMIWEEYPRMHEMIGCPVCSASLCATSRILKSPLRIISVRRERTQVIYQLKRGGSYET